MIKVLVTNDDGIDAGGLCALVEALSTLAEVYVFAPAEEQSGKSQSITFLRPVGVEPRESEYADAAYAVDGTPADCVKLGLTILKEQGIRPDYVISGINLGYNIGLAVYYSGTVAAAREGALNGVRSIALSVGSYIAPDAANFDYITGMLPVIFEMSDKLESDVVLNVNAPDTAAEDVKGHKIVETAPFAYGLDFVFNKESDGLYQMGGAPTETYEDMKYDFDAVGAGYVAISPVPTSMADDASLVRLRGLQGDDNSNR